MDTAQGVPFTDGWTSFELRRNRKSYFFAVVMLIAVTFMGVLVISLMFGAHAFGKIIGIFYFLGCLGIGLILSAQRLRDMNISGWFAFGILLLFLIGFACRQVPVVALFLMLCSYAGTQGSNRYGADPLLKRRMIW